MDLSASKSVSQSVSLYLIVKQTSASQSVCLSLTERLTFLNVLFRFTRYNNIRITISAYITKCEYNGPYIMDQSARQPVSQPVSLYVLNKQTNFSNTSQYVWTLTERLTFINVLFRFRRYKHIRIMASTYITEYEYNGPTSQPISQPLSQSAIDRHTDFYKWLVSFQKIHKYQENGFNLYNGVWI